MTCQNCGKEIKEGSQFCPFCGTRIAGDEPLPGGSGGGSLGPAQPQEGDGEAPAGIEERLQLLQENVSGTLAELSRLADRVSGLERAMGFPAATRPPRPDFPASDRTVRPPQGPPPPVPPNPPPAGSPGAGAAPDPPRIEASDWILGPRLSDRIKGWDWEWLLGGNWLARIGSFALVIGVGFFLKLAFDNNWIGETGRVALGFALGLALLGAGEYTQRRYPIWSQPITGGGIAILYLAIFAAFAFYGLILPLLALGLALLVTATAAGLALRYESITIAILGLIGGFLTPVLLGERLPNQRILLAYVLVLDLGVLALATFRNWRWFTLLGLLGSLALFGFWLDRLEPPLLLSQAGITAIFIIFMGATTLFHIVWKRAPGPLDQSLMVINAAAYFGVSYGLLFDEYRPWMGGFTLLLAVIYGMLGYAVLRRSREQVYLSLFSLGIALIFLTIAVPVQLGGPWISIAWSVEAAVLIWLSFTLKMNPLRWMGMAVFLVAAAWLLFIDTPVALFADRRPLVNAYTLAYGAAIAATYLAAYFLHRERETLPAWEDFAFTAYLTLGSLFLGVAVPVQVSGVWIPIVWAIEVVALMWLSYRLNVYQLRLFALGIFAVMLVRLLAFETFSVDLRVYRPILNQRVAAFAAGIAAAYAAACISWLGKDKYLTDREKVAVPAFLSAANLLTLWVLSAEVITTVDSGLVNVPNGAADNVKSLSLSILWALYAAGLMVLGIARRWRWVRLAGLALLAVPVIKLFGYDVFELDQGYRVAAFISLGGILMAGGFLYQRFRGAIRGFLLE